MLRANLEGPASKAGLSVLGGNMGTVIGIIGGFILSWVLAHYYYRRQIKEQINPIPHIEKLDKALSDFLALAKLRNDKELESKIKKVIIALYHTQLRLRESLSLPIGMLGLLLNRHKEGKAIELLTESKHLFESALRELNLSCSAYDELVESTTKLFGSDILNQLTTSERLGIEFKPRRIKMRPDK